MDMAFSERVRTPNRPSGQSGQPRRNPGGSGSYQPSAGSGRPGPNAGSPRHNLSREEADKHIRENRCFKCHQVGHRANDPKFHPRSNTPGAWAPNASTSNASPTTGNATYGSNGNVDDDQGSEGPPLRLDAASFRPSGARLPWREFEEVTLPSDQARSWRTKNE